MHLTRSKEEEELASIHSDDASTDGVDSEGDGVAADVRPQDKENLSPNTGDTTGKLSSERPHKPAGRKRKRQSSERARREDTAATRRQRIRQYYNGATHGSASAVQLFAMAMQVGQFNVTIYLLTIAPRTACIFIQTVAARYYVMSTVVVVRVRIELYVRCPFVRRNNFQCFSEYLKRRHIISGERYEHIHHALTTPMLGMFGKMLSDFRWRTFILLS